MIIRVLVLIVVAITLFFSGGNFWPGQNGEQGSTGEPASQTDQTAPESQTGETSSTGQPAAELPGAFPGPPDQMFNGPLPDTSRLLTVIVQEKHYLWGSNDNSTLPVRKISLEEVVAKARETTGNEQGIRVRIYHVGSALPSAEAELISALKAAGLNENEIFFEQQVIELPQS